MARHGDQYTKDSPGLCSGPVSARLVFTAALFYRRMTARRKLSSVVSQCSIPSRFIRLPVSPEDSVRRVDLPIPRDIFGAVGRSKGSAII